MQVDVTGYMVRHIITNDLVVDFVVSSCFMPSDDDKCDKVFDLVIRTNVDRGTIYLDKKIADMVLEYCNKNLESAEGMWELVEVVVKKSS